MITAQELRIGNLLLDNEGNICTVRAIDGERSAVLRGEVFQGTATVYIEDYNATLGKWVDRLSGIPLTGEWLDKFGFKKTVGVNQWDYFRAVGALQMYFRFNDSHAYSEITGIYMGSRIQYVHLLQNFFYAFTGYDLEVKK